MAILTPWASLVAPCQRTRLPMQETWVQFLGQEDPVEKEMAPHSGTLLPGKSHGQRSLVSFGPLGRTESDTTE